MPLALHEIIPAAAELPIIFKQVSYGCIPFALLSIDPEFDVGFISADGMFRASYVPMILRAHPFATAATKDGSLVAATDPSGGCLTASTEGRLFFDQDGKPHADTQPVLSKLNAWSLDVINAKRATQFLIDHKMLKNLEGDFWQAPSGAKLSDTCGDAEGFASSGAAALYYGHLISLRHMAKLRARQDMSVSQTQSGRASPKKENGGDEMIDLVSQAMNDTSILDDLL